VERVQGCRPASHEAGHNVGLGHDGTASVGYCQGHGAWAPIMGVGYYRGISQWSKGEYAGANNTEDDHAVIGSHGSRSAPTMSATPPTRRPHWLSVRRPTG
jgi:hypothetical protein